MRFVNDEPKKDDSIDADNIPLTSEFDWVAFQGEGGTQIPSKQ